MEFYLQRCWEEVHPRDQHLGSREAVWRQRLGPSARLGARHPLFDLSFHREGGRVKRLLRPEPCNADLMRSLGIQGNSTLGNGAKHEIEAEQDVAVIPPIPQDYRTAMTYSPLGPFSIIGTSWECEKLSFVGRMLTGGILQTFASFLVSPFLGMLSAFMWTVANVHCRSKDV